MVEDRGFLSGRYLIKCPRLSKASQKYKKYGKDKSKSKLNKLLMIKWSQAFILD